MGRDFPGSARTRLRNFLKEVPEDAKHLLESSRTFGLIIISGYTSILYIKNPAAATAV